MPDPLGPWDSRWADSNVSNNPRTGQVPRFARVPWFNTIWGNPRADAAPQGQAGFSELLLWVILAILGAGLPGEAILITLALAMALFIAIRRRPIAPGVVRGLLWLYRPLVVGEAVFWLSTWDATQRPAIALAEYSLVVLIVWLLVVAGRRGWSYARHA